MTKFIIVRHGQSMANLEGVYAAHLNTPLSPLGKKQAKRVGERLKEVPIHAVYSSDLQRAHDTVALAAKYHGLAVCDREELREIFGGDWEGKKFADLILEYPEEYGLWLSNVGKSRCVGGESVEEVSRRMLSALEQIAALHPDQTVLIGTHALALRTICTHALGLSLEAMKEVPFVANASISTFLYEDGKLSVVSMNDNDHLSGLETTLPINV